MSFPPTRLSVVAGLRSGEDAVRRVAFATLVEAYWKPVYKYLRLRWRLDPDKAADMTQDFFASALAGDLLSRYDASRGRFRTYLRVCLDSHAANARKAERRLKRGGAAIMVPLDFAATEAELERTGAVAGEDVEALFHREWARALFEWAVVALEAEAGDTGRRVMFEVFRRYDLADPESRPTYAALAAELGLTTAAVTNHLAAMRRLLREIVRARLRDITATDDEFRDEARRLLE